MAGGAGCVGAGAGPRGVVRGLRTIGGAAAAGARIEPASAPGERGARPAGGAAGAVGAVALALELGGPLVAVLAVGLALVVYVPRGVEDGVRLKGAVALRLVSAEGLPVANARPGERVTLAVGTATFRSVLVLAVDEAGAVDVLWPQGGRTSGTVTPGAEVRLTPPLEVTPGSVALHAFFSDAPLAAEPARAALLARVEEARAKGLGPLEAVTPDDVGKAHAEVRLGVEP